jgi:hypothetical protein
VDRADHSDHVFVRSRVGDENIFIEMARVVRESAAGLE